MTLSLSTEFANMQNEIDKLGAGHCVLVKLINYEELKVTISSIVNIVDDLRQIVRKVCSDFNILVYTHTGYNNVLLILPELGTETLKEFVFQIYTATQLYTKDNFPENYMNCKIATINFPKVSAKAESLNSLLAGVFAQSDNTKYHLEYNHNLHDLENLKNVNRKLSTFRKAIANKAIEFAYQPIFDRKTGYIPYYECLLRFHDENQELVSVGPIISAIEDKGLINLLDHIVLEMAINELAQDPNLCLSVNVSNVGVLDEHLLEMAEKLLEKHNNISSRLIIEITETLLNEDYEKTKSFIDRLHKYGCRFALDDFGSGFTSFKQLQYLPIDIVKIDGSYIRNLTSNHYSKYFIETLVRISEDLGIKTVAEFVENGETAKFLLDLKVDGMQGNFFSPASSTRE